MKPRSFILRIWFEPKDELRGHLIEPLKEKKYLFKSRQEFWELVYQLSQKQTQPLPED